MATISQGELRKDVADVLRRAEAGERLVITVSGRPVAELGPARSRTWVGGPALAALWEVPAPQGLIDDLRGFPGSLGDPFR